MRLTILKPGIYNDASNKSHRCEVGTEITTLPVYGQSLIDDGYARPVGAAPGAPPQGAQGGHGRHGEARRGVRVSHGAREPKGGPPGDTGGQPVSTDIDTLAGGGLSRYVISALRARGLRTAADVEGATDAELLSVRGIGEATLQRIRGRSEQD